MSYRGLALSVRWRLCWWCFRVAGTGTAAKLTFLISTNVKVPYWQTAAAGFSQAGSRLGVAYAFNGPDTYDPGAERTTFEAVIQKKPSGILVSVADPAVIKDSINEAIAAGIPVITIDSDAPTSKRLFFIGTNNYQAGVTGGKRLAQELKGKGTVAVFTMPEQSNLNERLQGYKSALEGFPRHQALAHY